MTTLFYAVLNAVQESFLSAGVKEVTLKVTNGKAVVTASPKDGFKAVEVFNGSSVVVKRVGFEQDACIKAESEIEAQLRIVKLFPPDTVEARAKIAFYGGAGSELLSKQFPNGCDLATAVRYFRSLAGELSCGEMAR